MKKLAAILFYAVLLFNLCGYQWVIAYLQRQHDVKLTAQLDRDDYANEDLISIKTPLSLPYYNSSSDFERVDGAIRIDGVEYRYVKRRIVADSLELLCLPNTGKQKLQTAKTDFFKIANDIQRPESNKKAGNLIKSVLPEYCDTLLHYSLMAAVPPGQTHRLSSFAFTTASFARSPEQPPETKPLSA